MMRRLLAGAAIAVASCCTLATFAQDTEARGPEIQTGKRVYEHWCAPCHGPGLGLPGFGGLPGTQQLRIKYRNTDIPAVLDQRTDLVPAFIETVVRQGVSFMPQFRKTEVSDEDLAALTAYLTRNNPENQ
jgi:mono/diheme cytochrome c family protein